MQRPIKRGRVREPFHRRLESWVNAGVAADLAARFLIFEPQHVVPFLVVLALCAGVAIVADCFLGGVK